MTETTPQDPAPRIETEQQAIERLETAFWRRYNANPELQDKLKGKDRTILLDIPDGTSHTFHVLDGRIDEIRPEGHAKPDIVITAKRADLFAIFNKELKARDAFLTRRVKVKAGLRDILFAKSLLGW